MGILDPRIRTLLSWQLRFQSRRLTTWLLGGGYLLVVLGAIAMSPKRLPPGVGAGVMPFNLLKTLHTLATFLLAVALDLAGAVGSHARR